jgi:hypothetical protein
VDWKTFPPFHALYITLAAIYNTLALENLFLVSKSRCCSMSKYEKYESWFPLPISSVPRNKEVKFPLNKEIYPFIQ